MQRGPTQRAHARRGSAQRMPLLSFPVSALHLSNHRKPVDTDTSTHACQTPVLIQHLLRSPGRAPSLPPQYLYIRLPPSLGNLRYLVSASFDLAARASPRLSSRVPPDVAVSIGCPSPCFRPPHLDLTLAARAPQSHPFFRAPSGPRSLSKSTLPLAFLFPSILLPHAPCNRPAVAVALSLLISRPGPAVPGGQARRGCRACCGGGWWWWWWGTGGCGRLSGRGMEGPQLPGLLSLLLFGRPGHRCKQSEGPVVKCGRGSV
mgnify:CR=1 FL=1